MTDTTRFAFHVLGTPRPQPRPRFVKGRAVSTGSDKAKLWRAEVERVCRRAVERLGEPPLFVGPVRVTLLFTFQKPVVYQASNPKRFRELAAGAQPRADVDNLAKLAMDVMERCGVFGNDRMVSILSASKVYGDKSSMAVLVEALGGQESVEPVSRRDAPPKWLTRS